MGVNIGFEEDGKGRDCSRPVIVFRKLSKETFWAIPLTMKAKSGSFFIPVDLSDGIRRFTVINQLRLVDSKRIFNKIGTLDKTTYLKIQKAIVDLCQQSAIVLSETAPAVPKPPSTPSEIEVATNNRCV